MRIKKQSYLVAFEDSNHIGLRIVKRGKKGNIWIIIQT